MEQQNIPFSKYQDKSYNMTDLHILGYNISFGYEDSYNYHDIDVDKILLFKKSDYEYFGRYNDVNKNKILPLQLKINNFSFGELDINNINDTADVDIGRNGQKNFIKCREIWNKIIESIGINDTHDFVEYYFDENGDDAKDEFIILEIEKNPSTTRDKNRNYLVFVFTSVLNNILQASLVQYIY